MTNTGYPHRRAEEKEGRKEPVKGNTLCTRCNEVTKHHFWHTGKDSVYTVRTTSKCLVCKLIKRSGGKGSGV